MLIIVYQAENKLTAKHVVEEAMTEAFVRKCNNCSKVFLKEGGCHRMKCLCGNLQCYVCEINVADYSHFDQLGVGKKCPLYGEMQELLNEQVAVAQERTVQELLKNRVELEDDDIRVDKQLVANALNPELPFVELQQNIAVPIPDVILPWGCFLSTMS